MELRNTLKKFTTKPSAFLWIAGIVVCLSLYWAILGIRLDSIIKTHIAECEAQLVDVKTQKCVMTFIPTAR